VLGRDYDRFLKQRGLRAVGDRSELRKLFRYYGWQCVFWPLLAGPRWLEVLAAALIAGLVRNVVYVALQTASSVGARVSTTHAAARSPKGREAWYRFQIETSKDFQLPAFLAFICGGLDKHIEHHSGRASRRTAWPRSRRACGRSASRPVCATRATPRCSPACATASPGSGGCRALEAICAA